MTPYSSAGNDYNLPKSGFYLVKPLVTIVELFLTFLLSPASHLNPPYVIMY